jgi:lipopolysaccharide transport system ATP-binding protein
MEAIHLDNVGKRFRLGGANDYGRLTEALGAKVRDLLGSKQSDAPKLPQPSPITQKNSVADQMDEDWFWALRNIDLTIATGDIVGFVGRNGAGKSTLLKILSRIVSPTEGRVGVRGRVGSLLEVGTGFHPELTGRENVFLNGAILGMSRADIRRRFDEIVAFAEIDSFLDTPVKRYSSGMSVRLAFAVAAHLEPDVLIIDEVLSVGDQAFQRKCLGKASQLGDQGRTILLVSHNLSAVSNFCKRAVLMQNGRMIAEGSPQSIIDRYLIESKTESGTRVWADDSRAPCSDSVRLQSVSVQGNGLLEPAGEVDIDQEIAIVVDYQVLVTNTKVSVQIQLKDETGAYVLWSANAASMNTVHDEWFDKPHPIGAYQTTCVLPANFLNDTRYFVSVLVGSEVGSAAIREDSVLSFLVHDTGAMRREYAGSWLGPVIRPRLAWRTTKEENNSRN